MNRWYAQSNYSSISRTVFESAYRGCPPRISRAARGEARPPFQAMQIYFSVAHDPTQLNRQDPDEGTQYRSEIFATSGAQQQAAEAYIAELDKAHVFASGMSHAQECNAQQMLRHMRTIRGRHARFLARQSPQELEKLS